jgi:hypothetical protein
VAIDFGLTAIGNIDSCPPSIRVGDFVMGEISIGLPLCVEPLPEGIIRRAGRRWQIDRISADLTTYVNRRRDITQITYKEVTSTEETKAVDYLLHCKELGRRQSRIQPVSKFVTNRRCAAWEPLTSPAALQFP